MTSNPIVEAAHVSGFNGLYPVGTPVRYWKGVREGDGKVARTRTAAQLLSGHTAVVWLAGVSGCIALTHIQPISEEELAAADRIPLTRPAPASTRTDRLNDARGCGHTDQQHRHTDGLEADARSQDQAVRELTAELERVRLGSVEMIGRAHYAEQQLAIANADLGRALDALATIRDGQERIDRALAAYDTTPESTPTPGLGSPAGRAQDEQAGLPAWVLDLVRGLDRYEVEHPKLFRYIRPGVYEPWDCPAPLLALVPAEVRRLVELPAQVGASAEREG